MAFQGLRDPVSAPIVTEVPGSPITYGTGVRLGAAIEANVTFERADNPLYGNDVIVENDNGITGGSVSFGTDDLDDAQQQAVIGVKQMGSLPDQYFEETAASAAPVGFGYIRVKKKGGVLKFVAYWIHKVQFGLNEDSAKTKADSIEWQTPTIEGVMMGVMLDPADNEPRFRRHRTFTTYAAAKAWLFELANITDDLEQCATPTATPDAGAVADEAEVTLETTTEGATIYYTTDGSAPTAGSMTYSTPITIYGPITIKAIAAKAGMANSPVLTAAYTISA